MLNIQKTKEEKLKDTVVEIDTDSIAGITNLKNANQRSYDLVWNNPEHTPQEICDFLGNQAYLLFVNSAKSQAFIKDIDSDHVELSIPEGYSVQINQDGTVTITNI